MLMIRVNQRDNQLFDFRFDELVDVDAVDSILLRADKI